MKLWSRFVCSFIGHDRIIRSHGVACYRCGKTIHPEVPPMPTGVQLVHMNGTRYPVDVKYAGQDYGIHVWEVDTPFPRDEIVGIETEDYPTNTTIEIRSGGKL